ncbi:MAG: hypothetical protein RI948_1485, partial [Bacteroidota bacterium]
MDFEKFTHRAQANLQQAQSLALANSQQAIEPGHLLLALLENEPDVIGFLLKKNQLQPKEVIKGAQAIVASFPKVSGAGQPYASPAFQAVLQRALQIQTELQDRFVSNEVLFLALLDAKDAAASYLKDLQLQKS